MLCITTNGDIVLVEGSWIHMNTRRFSSAATSEPHDYLFSELSGYKWKYKSIVYPISETIKRYSLTPINEETMKKQTIPDVSFLKTGMLIVNDIGEKAIVLIDGWEGGIGKVSGQTWFPIENNEVFTEKGYIHELWSKHPTNSHALNLSTKGRTLLWKREPSIMIDEKEVEFLKNEIKVGCTTVSHEIVKQIYNKIFNQ